MSKHSIPPLVDRFGRVHKNLRLSVTDRCNIRCFYCMPDEAIRFLPRDEILTFEEITRFVRAVVPMGITKLRITGGEPLVRAELSRLIEQLVGIDDIEDVALTTNAMLLAEQAGDLKQAGLHRINVSLDTLREETFLQITRRPGLDRVLQGIQAAQAVGFSNIRLNAVAIPNVNEDDILPLVAFARDAGLELRFIEFMPLDAEGNWTEDRVITGTQVRDLIAEEFGPLRPVQRRDHSQPARDYSLADGSGRLGFIDSVSAPFCGSCNRLRVTAEGQVRNCLFSSEEWDARKLLRGGASDGQIQQMVRDSVLAKKRGHGSDTVDFVRPERAMYQIGG